MVSKSAQIGQYCIIEDGVTIGDNTVIKNYVEIRKGAVIGADCYIDSGVKISGDCWIGDKVTLRYDVIIARGCSIGSRTYIAPRVMTNNLDTEKKKIGGAIIGYDCFIGTNAVIHHGIIIAPGTVIGAMSFVNKSVEKGVYVGIPAQKR